MANAPFDEWFSRAIGYPFITRVWWRRIRGRSQFGHLLREHLAAQYWPAERLEAEQIARLRALLKHAGRHVPYYRDLFQQLGFDPRGITRLSDIDALPPLTRQIVQEHEARLLADDAPQRGQDAGRTGGSTGVALQFWYDRSFYVHAEAAAWMSDMAAGRRQGTRTAYLWGAPRDLTEFRSWRGRSRQWLRNERYYDSHVLWDERLRQYHAAWQARPPGVLVGFASSIYHLALYLEREGLAPAYPLRAVISSGEVLDPDMRAALERVFPAPVFDRYGSREVGLLAYECEQHAGLHQNLLDVHLEVVGPDVDHQPGEVLVTQFHNYTMPFIRFQIDDLAVRQPQPCACGRTAPLLRRVAGRTSAAFISTTGQLIEGYHLIRWVRVVPGLRQFQLIQEAPRRLRLRVVAEGGHIAPEAFNQARADIAAIIGADCELLVEFVDHIPLPPSGKAQALISHVGRAAVGGPELPMLEARLAEWFSRAIGFPLIVNAPWRRAKDRRHFGRVLREKLASQYWPPERVEAYQLSRLRPLLEYAGAKVPYYRDLFHERGFDPRAVRHTSDLRALPPLSRQTVQAQGRRLLAEGLKPGAIGHSFTGGSTGIPLEMWYDRPANLHLEAAAWLGDMAAGRRYGTRTDYLWAGPRDPRDFAGWRGLARQWLRNEVRYDTHSASEELLARYHRAMQARRPDILVSYASTVTGLAHYLERHGLQPRYPRLAVIPSGEVLEPDMRADLERVFPAPVFNRYGSREVGLIAFECDRHTGLHLNPANLIVECAGPANGDVPGEVLATFLYNSAMPLIRYEMDDLAVWARQPCPCGRTSPMLSRVAGRRAATFLTAAGRRVEPYYLAAPIRAVPGLREFQLVQDAISRMRLLVVADPGCGPEAFAPVRADIATLIGPDCELTIEFVNHIPLPPSGKAQMFISHVGRAAAYAPPEAAHA